jgi:Tfp pilus assembly protein PilN
VRPVNLIPPEERRGEKAPMRTGSLAYVVVAVLGVALLAVVGIVLTNNQISDGKSQKSSLEAQVSTAQAEADRTSSFAEFASLRQTREQTVASLAQSRFDWERVLRELAIVIPHDVWLTGLNASVSPDAASASASTSASSTSSAGSESVTGPSLHIEGCAAGHEAVARFLAALQDVDGVTRVSVLKSDRPDLASSGGAATADSSGTAVGSGGCSSRDFVSVFELVAAFDAVQLDPAAQGIAPTTPTTPTTTPTTDSGQSQVADAGQQLQQQKDSAAQKTEKGRKAVDTIIPGTGTAP